MLAVAGQQLAGRRQGGAPPRPAGEPERIAVRRLRHGERAAREGALLLVLRGADDAGGEAAPPLAQRRSLELPLAVKKFSVNFHRKLVGFAPLAIEFLVFVIMVALLFLLLFALLFLKVLTIDCHFRTRLLLDWLWSCI